jgi:hypothetical protein
LDLVCKQAKEKKTGEIILAMENPHTGVIMRGADFVLDTEDNHSYVYYRAPDIVKVTATGNTTKRKYYMQCCQIEGNKLCSTCLRGDDPKRKYHICVFKKPEHGNILYDKLLQYKTKTSKSQPEIASTASSFNQKQNRLCSILSGVTEFFGKALIPFRAVMHLKPLLLRFLPFHLACICHLLHLAFCRVMDVVTDEIVRKEREKFPFFYFFTVFLSYFAVVCFFSKKEEEERRAEKEKEKDKMKESKKGNKTGVPLLDQAERGMGVGVRVLSPRLFVYLFVCFLFYSFIRITPCLLAGFILVCLFVDKLRS